MEVLGNAKTVRMRGRHDKYLVADDDKESVVQDRNGTSKRARWTVELVDSVEGLCIIRLRSCYDKYLFATDEHFLLGVTGKKVKQRLPQRLDSSVEWEVLRDGMQLKFKTRYGNFLRANGGVPPWRNSITHDVPSRSHTQDWILWDVEVLEFQPKEEPKKEVDESEFDPISLKSINGGQAQPGGFASASGKNEGRTIHYNVVDDDGNIVEGDNSLFFKGKGLQELSRALEEETELANVTLCSHNPLNGNLYPMKLDLPPNHVKLHVYVVPSSSKAAKAFSTTD